MSLGLFLVHSYPDLPYFCVPTPADERTGRPMAAGLQACDGLRAARIAGPTVIRILAPFGTIRAPC